MEAGELLSWPGHICAGIGAFLGHAPPPEGKDDTIREWVTRTLGEEVFLRCIDPFVSGVYAGNPETLSMKAALPKIARIEAISYSIDWNKFGAIFYGGLKRQVELTKERKADPPAPEWPEFEYGNPGHLDIIKELDEAESKTSGLWICGNYRSGVAFPDCVTFGYNHAKVVKDYLDKI